MNEGWREVGAFCTATQVHTVLLKIDDSRRLHFCVGVPDSFSIIFTPRQLLTFQKRMPLCLDNLIFFDDR